ncbi:hypothetical protein [Phyllobacterium leguminum]|uniref:Uncharacterized protein n=1 Tax=Phyllobacterium leguminum TaxID=314237 RepID=A0A318T151_9HYPH|nr:hypothetical protein [Phyllobacterium leguminum]PYE87416.1 hypothetical protein C7477_11338 [Phyllobacterium leguminum]
MFRFLFRVFAIAALALSVILAVLDAARSVGASRMVATPLADIWAAASPQTFADAKTLVTHYIGPIGWDPVLVWVLDCPAWAVFASMALLFYAMGYRREARFGHLVVD